MSSASASAKANKRHAARARDDWRTSRGEIDRREELRKLHFSVSSNDERTQEANRQSAKRKTRCRRKRTIIATSIRTTNICATSIHVTRS